MKKTLRIHFRHISTVRALEAFHALEKIYHNYPTSEADAIVVLGGDGAMLQSIHHTIEFHLPLYGMNLGTVGFLMNEYVVENLEKRIWSAQKFYLQSLCMHAVDVEKKKHCAWAINEVSLFRRSSQLAKIKVSVDDVVRIEELMCDGILVATPAGSTAYNSAVFGPILPLGTPLLALTPISPFRPKRWRGAILPARSSVSFDMFDVEKRPVSVVADYVEYKDIAKVEIQLCQDKRICLLFDSHASLDERVLSEQFL